VAPVTAKLPGHARAVIVGGGIVGCSTAYHLAALGWTDIVLLEKAKLTSGTTHHAAGLVGQLRTSANITQLLGQSIALYDRLEAETGLATGWKMNGGLRLACTPDRMHELNRQAAMARSFGLNLQLLSPREALELWPAMEIAGVIGAAFLPTDGQANPTDITQALARGARTRGVTIIEDCPVTGVTTESFGALVSGERVTGITTKLGDIQCDVVVNCCGQWAREFGALAGVNVPLVSVQHQYLVTQPIDGLSNNLPTLRDPDNLTYFKVDAGALVMGGYEPQPIAWALDGIPDNFEFTLLDANWAHFEPFMEAAMARVPALREAGIRQLINGPESFTPDGNFILGEAPECSGYFVGAGFNAFGIAAGGGAGQALAEWIYAGEAPYDLWPVDIRRFGPPHRDVTWVRARTLEMYGKHYSIAWPHEESSSARPLRRSPLYDRLKNAGACFGEKLGWERANWFAAGSLKARDPIDAYGFEHQPWFDAVAQEHHAVRRKVGLFDQSSFAKFLVTGQGAQAGLQWLCANDVGVSPGRVVYTQLLNTRGGIECDLTIVVLSPERYYIVTGTGFATHDLDYLTRGLRETADAQISEVTSGYSVLSLFGPNARALLESLDVQGIGNDTFPFASARDIALRGTRILALRISYVGELGWELHIPTEFTLSVYDQIIEAGQTFGLRNCGYRAIESLRLEKGYRAWGADITADTTPYEAGLGFAVKDHNAIPFVGGAALLRQRARPLLKRLAGFSITDKDVVLLGRESILRNEEQAGWLSSGGYGHSLGCGIGYGYVRNAEGVDRDYLMDGSYELEVSGQRVPATIHLGPLYDPTGRKLRC
jgi:sarcosine dehydrogenase